MKQNFQKNLQKNIEKETFYTYSNITSLENYYKYVYVYNKSNIKSKNEILKTKNIYYVSYYCRNDTCVSVDNKYNKNFIEFPDEYGNINLYITKTLSYNAIKYNNVSTVDTCSSNKCILYSCSANSECLSNKCFNNLCVFNDETPIVHCDDIFKFSIFGKSSYMHCGKAYQDTCKNNNECSSKKCSDGFCDMQMKGPSDIDSLSHSISLIILFIVIIIIFILLCIICFCKCHKSYKGKNKFEKKTEKNDKNILS